MPEVITMADTVQTSVLNYAKNISIGLEPFAARPYVKSLRDQLRDIPKKAKTALLAFVGEMSSGKSSLMNILIGIPLLPVSKVVTSTNPVELRYGDSFRLQVFLYDEKKNEKIIYTMDSADAIDGETLKALKAYVKSCIDNVVLIPENMAYYYDLYGAGALEELDAGCVEQVAQLLMFLLSGYVGQDSQNRSENRTAIIEERKRLIAQIFGLGPADKYAVRVSVNADLLRSGLVLVDLPGLGADVEVHSEITNDYLERADCCILLVGINGKVKAESETLNRMLKYEKMATAGKDSRFMVVMNMCDQPYKNDDEPEYAIAQAVLQIKEKITQINMAQILPVSALYGEYRLTENGILPGRTVCGKKMRRNAQANDDDMPSDAAIRKRLLKNYDFVFSYTDPLTKQQVRCSTRELIEQRIGQYAGRVRFLNALYQFRQLVDQCGNGLSELEIQAEMIRMLQSCGDDLMTVLLQEVSDALDDTQNEFSMELSKALVRIHQETQEFAQQRVGPIQQEYLKKLRQVNDDMNNHLSAEIGKMEKDFAGHYCIDEKNDKSIRNKAIFDHLESYFRNFDFDSYLKAGDGLLSAELERERSMHQQNKAMFVGLFDALISNTRQALDQAYAAFEMNQALQTVPQKDQQIYKECFDRVKKSILDHLDRLRAQMITAMDKDKTVDQEISKTTSKLSSFFDRLISVYHNAGANHLNVNKSLTFLNDRPCLDVKSIRQQIDRPFVASSTDKDYVSGIDDIFSDPETGHVARLQEACQEAFSLFSQEATNRIQQFFLNIKASVTTYNGAAQAQIAQKYLQLASIATVIYEQLISMTQPDAQEGGAFAAVDFGMAQSWAAADAEVLREAALKTVDEAAKFVDEMKAAGGASAEEQEHEYDP